MVNSKYAMTTICNILMNLIVLETKVTSYACGSGSGLRIQIRFLFVVFGSGIPHLRIQFA